MIALLLVLLAGAADDDAPPPEAAPAPEQGPTPPETAGTGFAMSYPSRSRMAKSRDSRSCGLPNTLPRAGTPFSVPGRSGAGSSAGRVSVMSVSPDTPNIIPVIRRLREANITVFLTHTRANVAQTEAALDAMASGGLEAVAVERVLKFFQLHQQPLHHGSSKQSCLAGLLGLLYLLHLQLM